MKFVSTRGQSPAIGFSEAVATGLAPDGGLFLPESLPDISGHLSAWESLSYADLCKAFFSLFATDIPEQTLSDLVDDSYSRFTHEKIAPLIPLQERVYVQELFHGPTLAFKDFALQLLGNLYEEQIRKTGRAINVLGATSGDTGSAAIHGLLGKEGVNIFILFPEGRISPLQERQMTTTGAANVFPIAIEGTFDDGQRIVKEIFGDLDFKKSQSLSAVNSINLARILAQCVYYLYAWFQLPEKEREHVEFIVPTGNFGNILAGWLTKKMGLPVASFCVATNQNDILHKLFTTGSYKVRSVEPSLAPSMDIQVASNFERFLYLAVDRDSAKLRDIMETLKTTGQFHFGDLNTTGFRASKTSDAEIESLIKEIYATYEYVADPHTACAFKEVNKDITSVVLATAHPAKFPDTIEKVIGLHPTSPSLDALKDRPIVKKLLPADTQSIREYLLKNS